MRLNVWQRAGIVASVLWMVGGALWARASIVKQAVDVTTGIRLMCERGERDGCNKAMDAARDAILDGWEMVALVTAVAPVIFGWVLAYIVVWTARWVLAGRSMEPGGK